MQYYYESNADLANYCYIKRQAHPFADLHFHTSREMIIVIRGRMLAKIGDAEYEIPSGHGCFVDRLTLHSYRELAPDTEVFVLVGDGALWAPVFSEAGGKPGTTFEYANFSVLDTAVRIYEQKTAQISAFKGVICLICAELSANGALSAGNDRPLGFNISPVLYYIDENFREHVTLDVLARRFGYTPQYFSKMFNKHVGMGLSEYVNAKRVSFAHAMLSSGKTVAEIAELSGFNSTVSFYRAYKRTFGKLPRD